MEEVGEVRAVDEDDADDNDVELLARDSCKHISGQN